MASYGSWQMLIDQAVEFVRSVSNADRLLLLYNGDSDGCVAATYLDAILSAIVPDSLRNSHWVGPYSFLFEEEVETVHQQHPDILTALDIPLHQEPDVVAKMRRVAPKVMIYDHHVIDREDAQLLRGVVYLNSLLLDDSPANHPASFFGYSLARILNPRNSASSWLLGVGLIGDYALDRYPEVQAAIRRSDPSLLEGDTPYSTILGRINALLNAGFKYDPLAHRGASFDAAREAYLLDNPRYFFDTTYASVRELHEYSDLLHVAVTAELEEFEKGARFFKHVPLVAHRSQSQHFIAGTVASIMAARLPDKVVIVAHRTDSRLQNEIRIGDNLELDLTEILRLQEHWFACLSSGGHPRAAGALIRDNEFESFITSFARAMEVK